MNCKGLPNKGYTKFLAARNPLYQDKSVVRDRYIVWLIVYSFQKAQNFSGHAARHAIDVNTKLMLECAQSVYGLLVKLPANRHFLQESNAYETLLELSDVISLLAFKEDLPLTKLLRTPARQLTFVTTAMRYRGSQLRIGTGRRRLSTVGVTGRASR